MKNAFLILVSLLLLSPDPSRAEEFRFSPKPNKAHLIQWRPWSRETLAEAKQKDRLILLSLSAVWCHWCHVMDETTYSDDEVIAYLNEHVIPVRVDSDMRPDIDSLYNQGGWPSTAILTPEGEVISGGNYLSPEELLGRLKRAVALYGSDRGSISRGLAEMQALRDTRKAREEGAAGLPDKTEIGNIVQMLKDAFDPAHGGFGTGQKFPDPDAVDFLLSVYARDQDRQIGSIVVKTLDGMADHGLFDKVEAGFFRYATKPDWSEPHYEKMLAVNAGLIRNYARASEILGMKKYATVAERTVQYVRAHLQDPASNAFYGSQDADEEYYRKKERTGLKQPLVDRTVYADSSSLMISGLLSAYEATGRREYLDDAVKGADFMLRKLYSAPDGVYHYFREGSRQGSGLLSDNALFGSALLDLYNETGRERYLNAAKEIGRFIVTGFFDADGKRFRSSLESRKGRPLSNGPLLAMNENLANYRALRFLSRLAYAGGIDALAEARDAALVTLSREHRTYTHHAGAFGTVLLWTAGEPVRITILARKDDARKYLDAIRGVPLAEKAVRVLSLSADIGEIIKLGYTPRESVYLCAGKRCLPPIAKPELLKPSLGKLRGAGP
jgi:uncharacterized protein YyaL (SSP411 family)